MAESSEPVSNSIKPINDVTDGNQSQILGGPKSSTCVVESILDPHSFDWQSTKSVLKERFKYILENKLFCDVTFIVGSGEETQKIPAFKALLMAGSCVFYAMFSGKWSADCNEVELPDVEPSAFREFLRFLYSDEVTITAETVSAITYIAKKYAVRSLEDRCSEFFLSVLQPGNAFNILIEARLFDDKKLAEACLKVIDDHTVVAVEADDFCNVDVDTLCLVLNRNSLRISEIMLFEAVVRWSVAECRRKNIPEVEENQRLVADRALLLIRFPLMFEGEFSSRVAESGLLSDRNLVQMLLYFSRQPKSAPLIGFSAKPRKGLDLVARRLITLKSKGSYGQKCDGSTSHSIGFSADHDIQLIGFGLYGSFNRRRQNYLVDMILKEKDKSFTLYQVCDEYDGQNEIFRILFKNPIKLAANTQYQVTVLMKGPSSNFGIAAINEVTLNLPRDQKVKISFYGVDKSSVVEGQIPELLFYM